ncbi:MAG: hypothetical protein ACR2KK_21820 [Acidimicrobiales bacterium]
MPAFLPPDRAFFGHRSDGVPIALLPVGAGALNLPSTPAARVADVSAAGPLPGWSLLPQLLLTVVDGPGDLGFLVATEPTESGVAAKTLWCESVDSLGGAIVLLLAEPPSPEALAAPDAIEGAGGFVKAMAPPT